MIDPDDEDRLEEDGEILAIAREIRAGRDTIEVPTEFLSDELPLPVEQSLPTRIAAMTVGQRLKLALTAGRDARNILMRDGVRLVQRFVLNNPRLSEEELISLAKSRSVDQDLLEIICKKNEWVANYQIRFALVTNPKTPVPFALRHLPTLKPRDLRILARSKNVPSAVNGAAKRLVLARGG